MSVSPGRLQSLRRQSGVAPPAPKRVEVDPLQVQVALLRNLLRVKRSPRQADVASADRTIPGNELAPGLWLQETWLPSEIPWPNMLDGSFDRRDSIPTQELLFFDTETTGLAGGTGTRAFMIGAADLQEGGLRVRQLTIANNSAEQAMLSEFRSWLSPTTILVSYNGKSYDAPLLKMISGSFARTRISVSSGRCKRNHANAANADKFKTTTRHTIALANNQNQNAATRHSDWETSAFLCNF